jgi:two-component sensor histidine kinase
MRNESISNAVSYGFASLFSGKSAISLSLLSTKHEEIMINTLKLRHAFVIRIEYSEF